MAVLPVPLVALVATLRPANEPARATMGAEMVRAAICTVCGVVCAGMATRARPSSTTTGGPSSAANQYPVSYAF